MTPKNLWQKFLCTRHSWLTASTNWMSGLMLFIVATRNTRMDGALFRLAGTDFEGIVGESSFEKWQWNYLKYRDLCARVQILAERVVLSMSHPPLFNGIKKVQVCRWVLINKNNILRSTSQLRDIKNIKINQEN